MSTTAGPSVSRSASHRHQSGSSRTAPSSAPHRPQSQSQSYKGPPASPQSGTNNSANVARRDFEQSNASAPTSAPRSGSRDRAAASSQPSRTDSARNQPRQPSRSDTGRYASIDAAATQQPPTNGVVRDAGSHAIPPTGGRRRTTITTSTGTWMLGKTIGAGSMGKVKLAKNAETGEQVRITKSVSTFCITDVESLGCHQDSTATVHRRTPLRSRTRARRTLEGDSHRS